MVVGFAANAALMRIELEDLQIRASGSLDLRGFLGLDASVNPGYDQVGVEFTITSKASSESLERLLAQVLDTSPNFSNFRRAIGVMPTLMVKTPVGTG